MMWDDADLYDLETAEYTADIPYWQELIDQYRPRRVLELACGTGRLLLPVARWGQVQAPGFQIVGLDSSPALLARAHAKCAEAGLPPVVVRLVAGDMRAFDLGEPFDLIIMGFNALAYLHTLDDQLGCLRAVRRHLAPGGRFAIDLLVPLAAFLAEVQRPPPALRIELDHAVPAAGVQRFLRLVQDRYDPVTQTDHSAYQYAVYYEDGQVIRRTDELAWHMYFPRELELLLRLAGLAPVACYGGYDRAPFNGDADKYLWVMEAA
jgi:SAM-dependent methyltransferase